MVLTTLDLVLKYSNYSDNKGKISRDLRDGTLIQLKREIYEDDKKTPDHYLDSYIYAHHIYPLIMFYQSRE